MKPDAQRTAHGATPATLTIAATTLFVLLFALVMYELDHQHYMNAKHQIIRDNFYELFNWPGTLRDNSRAVLFLVTPREREMAETRLRNQLRAIVSGPTSAYSLRLTDPDGTTVLAVEDPEKPSRLNDFSNNLFSRSFSRVTDLALPASNADNAPVGHLIARFTSPQGYAPIERLTKRYRLYAAALAAVFAAVYYFFYRYLLRPMHVITRKIEESTMGSPGLVLPPEGALETAYNKLAAQALLQEFQQRLSETANEPEPAQRRDKIAAALEFAEHSFGAKNLVATELAGRGETVTVFENFATDGSASAGVTDFTQAVRSAPKFDVEPSGVFEFAKTSGDLAVVVSGQLDTTLPALDFRRDCIRRVCDILHSALITLRVQEQNMVKQRSEANIVLSRNLGHDLTNIIATTKLDLMVVRQLLNENADHVNGQKRQLLRQSVNGVLESTRFLQEIVNIYRSFSYVKKPAYERHQLREVIEQFLQSFEPSVSSRIKIERDYGPDMPTLILEPRLLKLALFNVATNAIDALKRDNRAQKPNPKLLVRARYHAETNDFHIELEDNGPGIRDANGNPLPREKTDALFQYGYSTKAERSEGLGLNWVRTIVEDFHDGIVTAENIETGGARFTLRIKSMESAEAKIGD